MTKVELQQKPVRVLKEIAKHLDLTILPDYGKDDISELICAHLGSEEGNRVGWRLLGQFK